MQARPPHPLSRQPRVPPADNLAAWVRLRIEADQRSRARLGVILLSGFGIVVQGIAVYCFYESQAQDYYGALGAFILGIVTAMIATLLSWLAVALAMKFQSRIGRPWFLAGLIPAVTPPLFIGIALSR